MTIQGLFTSILATSFLYICVSDYFLNTGALGLNWPYQDPEAYSKHEIESMLRESDLKSDAKDKRTSEVIDTDDQEGRQAYNKRTKLWDNQNRGAPELNNKRNEWEDDRGRGLPKSNYEAIDKRNEDDRSRVFPEQGRGVSKPNYAAYNKRIWDNMNRGVPNFAASVKRNTGESKHSPSVLQDVYEEFLRKSRGRELCYRHSDGDPRYCSTGYCCSAKQDCLAPTACAAP